MDDGAELSKLIQLHAFGGKGGIRDSIGFTSDNTVVHAVGVHVALFNLETRETHFLQKSKNAIEILALAIAPNLRAVALCERTREVPRPMTSAGAGSAAPSIPEGELEENKAQVSVYHVASRRRMRTMTLLMKGDFHHCAFSGDNKFLATAGGSGADTIIVIWKWNAEKVVAMTKCQPGINRLRFVPRDSSLLSVSGPGYLKIWRCQGDTLREVPLLTPKQENENFVEHDWMGARPSIPGEPLHERRMLAATESGLIYVFSKAGEGILDDISGDDVSRGGAGAVVDGRAAESKEVGSGFELRSTLQLAIEESKSDPAPTKIKSLVAYGKGFAVSGTNGFFAVYEKTDDKKEPFVHIKSFNHGDDSVTSMAVAPSDELLVAYSALSMFRSFPLSMIDTVDAEQNHFSPILDHGVHTRSVVCMDTCVQQPTAVTCSSDRTVRIWNYLHWTCEVAERLLEDPVCVALHPSGLSVAVGSKDQLVIYNVLIRSLSEQRSFPAKQIRAVRFSNGGGMLAASVGLMVQVFHVFSGELLYSFPGHIGAIRQLVWSDDDRALCSVGEDGHVYAFSLDTTPPGRIEDLSHVVKTCRFTTCALTPDKSALVSAGRDTSHLCILQVASRGDITTYNTNNCRITKLCFSRDGNMLFCGTATGSVRVYQWPLVSAARPGSKIVDTEEAPDTQDEADTSVAYAVPEPSFVEFPLQCSRISGISVSRDGRYLLSSSDDGSIFVLGIPFVSQARNKRGSMSASVAVATAAAASSNSGGLTWQAPSISAFNAEVTLVNRDEMEDALTRLAAMEKKLEEVKTESEYAMHVKEREWSEKAAGLTEQMEAAIAVERARYDELQARHEAYVREQVELREAVKVEHSRMAQGLENQYETKLALEMERYDNLSEQLERLRQGCEALLRETQERHTAQLSSLTETIRRKDEELRDTRMRMQRDLDEKDEEHKEAQRQVESEYEQEISALKVKFQAELGEEESKTMKKESALTSQGNKLESLKKRMVEAKAKCTAKEKECDRLNHKILQLNEKIRTMGRALEARDTALMEKEKEVTDLRTENRTLENLRFVLEHKVSAMSSERGPITAHVSSLESHIESMYKEMVSEFEDKKTAARTMANKDAKIDSLTTELAALRSNSRDKERKISAFQAATESLLHVDSKHLEQAVKEMYLQLVKQDKALQKNIAASRAKLRPAAEAKTSDAVLSAGASASAGAGAGASAGEATTATEGGSSAAGGAAVRASARNDDVPLKDHQDTVEEIIRQKDFLVQSTVALKRQLHVTTKTLTRKAKMATDDNMMLMQEVNELRRQLVDGDRKTKLLEKELLRAKGKKNTTSLDSTFGSTSLPVTTSKGGSPTRLDSMGSRSSAREPPKSPIAPSASAPELPTRDSAISGDGGAGNQARSGGSGAGGSRPNSRGSVGVLQMLQSKSQAAPFSRKPLATDGAPDSSRPNSRSSTRVARGSTRMHRETIEHKRTVDTLHAQIERNERELAMQRGEIQRLRVQLSETAVGSGPSPGPGSMPPLPGSGPSPLPPAASVTVPTS